MSGNLKKTQKIVVKLGTRLLTYNNGKLNLDYMERMVRELANLKNKGTDLIIVSSGAIGAGIGRLNLKHKPKLTAEKQAVAAVGQGLLIQFYEKLFAEYGHVVAQILLTREDLIHRQRYVNACNTMQKLLDYNVVPIINENDSIAVEEIEFGDNDTLSALVAGLIDADLLVIFSDIDGFYTANPWKAPDAKLIPVVEEITPELKAMAHGATEELGTGGMVTKLQAAEIAVNCGIDCIVTSGLDPGILNRISRGEPTSTLFKAKKQYLRGRKRWIAFGQTVHGKIIVDEGARQAILQEGKSLLPTGIIDVCAQFESGDLVSVCEKEGQEFARGLVNYSSEELKKIKGKQSNEVFKIIGSDNVRKEAIHRDNLVIY